MAAAGTVLACVLIYSHSMHSFAAESLLEDHLQLRADRASLKRAHDEELWKG